MTNTSRDGVVRWVHAVPLAGLLLAAVGWFAADFGRHEELSAHPGAQAAIAEARKDRELLWASVNRRLDAIDRKIERINELVRGRQAADQAHERLR